MALADVLSAAQRRQFRQQLGIQDVRQLPGGLREPLHQYGLLPGGRTVAAGIPNAGLVGRLQQLGQRYQAAVPHGAGPGQPVGASQAAGGPAGGRPSSVPAVSAPASLGASGAVPSDLAPGQVPAGYSKYAHGPGGAAGAYRRRLARQPIGGIPNHVLSDVERRDIVQHGGGWHGILRGVPRR